MWTAGEPTGLVSGYLALALRLDRLLPGLVDGADPALRRVMDGEPVPVPADLVRQAGRLAQDLPSAGFGPARERFLAAQLRALEWTARRLTGQPVRYVDEVAAAFDVRIALGPEDGYRRAHQELDALLPGPGSLSDRWVAHRRRDEIPREHLDVAVRALTEALRAPTRAAVPLSRSEDVECRIVDDAPWSAMHRHLGGFRSRVTVNAAARPRRSQLGQLLAHEAYPGHHTERCRKEAGLVADGWAEHRMVIVTSPQSLVAEGAAELGLHAVVGPGWGRFAAEVLAEVGLGFDGELAERVDGAAAGLARIRQDAALLLHGRRAAPDVVLGHLRRWLLIDDIRARQVLRFLAHPLWRSYPTTYIEGRALVRRWWERDPSPERFRRLLDEPLTPGALRAESARAAEPVSIEPVTSTATSGGGEAMDGRLPC